MNAIIAALERLLAPLAQALVPHLIDHITAALEAKAAGPVAVALSETPPVA